MATSEPDLYELARAVIAKKMSVTYIAADDVMSDDDPAIEALSDEAYWELARKVDAIVATAQLSVTFPMQP